MLGDDFFRLLTEYMRQERKQVHRVLHQLQGLERTFLLRSDVQDAFDDLCAEPDGACLRGTPLGTLLGWVQEAVVDAAWVCLSLRVRVGRWAHVRIHMETMVPEKISVNLFLQFKERLVNGAQSKDAWPLEIDLQPFSREFPKMHESRSIGRGVEFLNRRLSSRLFEDLGKGDKRLLDFLRVHNHRGQQLMLNEMVRDVNGLRLTLRDADESLRGKDPDADCNQVCAELRTLGFEPGWGKDVRRMRETMQLLLDILEAPSPDNLERFLARIPMIFSIVILSPHGWFGQSDVLGRPDTGGQVVYILDQVRALEQEMRRRLAEQGLEIEPRIIVVTRLIPQADGTTCDQRMEPITGTRHASILRVPFVNAAGEVLPHWISRFEVWPYLERFSLDAEREVLAELGGRPDFIIGNYSDGNLVASIISQRLGVTQCNIAHALEKTKYLYSDLYWRANDAPVSFFLPVHG